MWMCGCVCGVCVCVCVCVSVCVCVHVHVRVRVCDPPGKNQYKRKIYTETIPLIKLRYE